MSKIYLIGLELPEDNSSLPRLFFSSDIPKGFPENAFKLELQELCTALGQPKVTNSKVVIIKDVNDPIYSQFVEGTATRLPSNGRYAQPVFVGQQFASALEATRHLGFNNQEVSLYLSKARHNPSPADRKVTLRGVTLMYDCDDALTYRD